MKSEDVAMTVIIGLWFSMGVASGFGAADYFRVRPMHHDAISAGVAEYHITDPETGKSEFRFIPCECK